jgi:hypothetical protein
MKAIEKALPYPVLGRGDDFTDSQFQSTLDASIIADESVGKLKLEYQFQLSSPEVADLLQQGAATFALDVQCSDTLYRRVFQCREAGTIEFASGELHGRVEILPCVVALRRIEGFRASDINPEFGEAELTFDSGDVFAIDDSQVKYVEFNRLKIESLVKVKRSEDIPECEYRIHLDGDHIFILMGAGCKRVWDFYRQDKQLAPFLAMSIYKDCLHAAIQELCESDEALSWRWGRALSERLNALEIRLPQQPTFDSVSAVAQSLVAAIGVGRLLRHVE